MKRKNLSRLVLITALLLLVPLVAMQFTDQVAWSLSDFVVAGALLIATGLMYESLAVKTSNTKYRVSIGIALAAVLALIWIQLAVGIFD